MELKPIKPNPLPFKGYVHPLKTLFKKGLFPSVTTGLYGGKLTIQNCSLEHLKCVSAGGRTTYRNLALATQKNNSTRGSAPLGLCLSWNMLEEYLKQFNFRIRGLFDGFAYQKQLRQTCSELGVQPPTDVAEKIAKQELPKKILRSMRNKAKRGLDIIV